MSPFWATLVGVRRDFGPGAHTHAAFGVEGLAPYRFGVQATAYVADNGGVSARLKGSYDLLVTNRLILSPEIESNVYGKANPERSLGTGLGNIELQVRLRYEISRKLAPYVGYDWDLATRPIASARKAHVSARAESSSGYASGVESNRQHAAIELLAGARKLMGPQKIRVGVNGYGVIGKRVAVRKAI